MKIPRKMSNEESKLVAAIVVAERANAITTGNLIAAHNAYNKFLSGSLLKQD